jgi:hypothetical protein
MKSRLVEEAYDKVGIRIAGGVLCFVALYGFIHRWSERLK